MRENSSSSAWLRLLGSQVTSGTLWIHFNSRSTTTALKLLRKIIETCSVWQTAGEKRLQYSVCGTATKFHQMYTSNQSNGICNIVFRRLKLAKSGWIVVQWQRLIGGGLTNVPMIQRNDVYLDLWNLSPDFAISNNIWQGWNCSPYRSRFLCIRSTSLSAP